MKLVYITYYDHTERAHYSPALVIENWVKCNERLVFCSPGDYPGLLHLDATVVDIGMGVGNPSDIPRIMNACMDWCYNAGYTHVVCMHGDQYVTPAVDKLLYASAVDDKVGYVDCMFNQLYVEQWHAPNSCMLSNANTRVKYDVRGDGQVLVDDAGVCYSIPKLGDELLLDIGYLGTPQYYGKMFNHNFIWPDGYKVEWLNTFHANPSKAIEMAYRSLLRVKNATHLVPINFATYAAVIDRLDQMQDYGMCMDVLTKIGLEL